MLSRLVLMVGVMGAATTLVVNSGTTSLSAITNPPPPLTCYNPSAPYAYGATDVNAEVGNSSVTALFDRTGTLTVLRSLAANEDNQVNFFASGYDPSTGAAIASQPNDGAFVGLRYVTGGVPHFTWLRDLESTQQYVSDAGMVVETDYAGPVGSGLSLTDTAFATASPLDHLDPALSVTGPDALIQHFDVTKSADSPVSDVALIAYGNWNPTATQVPYIPLADSGCASGVNSDKVASFDTAAAAAVVSWSGVDASTGQPASSAVAVGWSKGTTSWQVGGDSTDPLTPATDPVDGFRQLSAAPFTLGDATGSVGQTTVAMASSLAFVPASSGSGSVAGVDLTTTVGSQPAGALSELQAARSQGYADALQVVKGAWDALLARAPTPSADTETVTIARRALAVALLAVDPETGAIVAAPDTQGPYAEDWVRDGSFIDHMLDENGFQDLVTRHELFYVRTQSSPTHPIASVPFGNWPMVMYPSGGGPGGPIPYEIDETGYGAWTLWDHASALTDPVARLAYVREVFPAMARAADWLTICRDQTNGFQCTANEDDNYTPTQTLHGALPALLGLHAALAAAGELGIPPGTPRVAAWAARAATLARAVGGLYDSSARAYRESPSSTNSLPVSFEDGGLMLWPTQLQGYSTAAMRGEANAVYQAMEASFGGTTGAYEAVALLGLCHAAGSPLTAGEQSSLGTALGTVMHYTTTAGTGLFGEFWQKWGDGSITPANDMPHTWEGALFDMAALCIYPPAP
jgi:hypothetical protein